MGASDNGKTIFDGGTKLPVVAWYKKPWAWVLGAFIVLAVVAFVFG